MHVGKVGTEIHVMTSLASLNAYLEEGRWRGAHALAPFVYVIGIVISHPKIFIKRLYVMLLSYLIKK